MSLCVVVPWDSEEARRWEHRTGSLVPRPGMAASQWMVLEDGGVCRGEAGGSENQHKAPRVAPDLSASFSGPNQDEGLGRWLSKCLRALALKENQGSVPSVHMEGQN